MNTVRICKNCNESKDLQEFPKKISRGKVYRKRVCKICQSIQKKEYYNLNRTHILKVKADYAKNNKDKIAKRKRNYRLKNKEKISKRRKAYYKENKDKLLNKARDRRKKDIRFKTFDNLRRKFNKCLHNKRSNLSIREFIGCSNEELKIHLESQFTEGMTWNNYGEWHIDHIKPCASFDFNNKDHIKECFHYTNLQPLWAIDNLKKGAKCQ